MLQVYPCENVQQLSVQKFGEALLMEFQGNGRVTRLGEFLPFGTLSTLDMFLKNTFVQK
jgi:hypothetical protein